METKNTQPTNTLQTERGETVVYKTVKEPTRRVFQVNKTIA